MKVTLGDLALLAIAVAVWVMVLWGLDITR
jgi:hypothetical protein